MSLAPFAGSSLPRSLYQLERDTEDALGTADSKWEREHNGDGTHAPFASFEVLGPISRRTVMVDNGIIELNGQLRVLDGSDGIAAITLATTANDVVMPDGSVIKASLVKLALSADSTLTGCKVEDPALNWDFREWINGSNSTLTIAHNSTSSTDGYRFACPNSLDVDIPSGGVFFTRYDVGARIWRVFISGGGQVIRSIQQNEISISGDGSTPSGTQTISAVDTGKTVVINRGWRNATRGMTVTLTNSTTVTATRESADFGNAVTVGFTVVEYA